MQCSAGEASLAAAGIAQSAPYARRTHLSRDPCCNNKFGSLFWHGSRRFENGSDSFVEAAFFYGAEAVLEKRLSRRLYLLD
jgi:hypothetical protein